MSFEEKLIEVVLREARKQNTWFRYPQHGGMANVSFTVKYDDHIFVLEPNNLYGDDPEGYYLSIVSVEDYPTHTRLNTAITKG